MSESEFNHISTTTEWLGHTARRLSFGCRRLAHRTQMLRHWWLKRHRPFQPLFTIATARSGSNLLTEFIGQLAGVQTHYEVLCHLAPEGPRTLRVKSSKALRHIRYSLQMLDAPIRGCKLLMHQFACCGLSVDRLENAFSSPNYSPPKYIVLYRESLAEQYISLQTALATNQWAVYAGEESKQALVRIDPDDFRRYSETVQRDYREVLAHPAIAQRGILLSYEQLTRDPAGCLRHAICPHLGVPAHEPTSTHRKQAARPRCDRVAHYSTVAALLNGPLGRQHHALPALRGRARRAA
jgi:LPS sulfotransferase NodH